MDMNDGIREMAEAFCAGSKPPQNGLEERLDMIAAQLSVIAYELHEMRERKDRD
jgi:hypothetical protein